MGPIFAAFAAVAMQAAPATVPEQPRIGRCHMGSCSWFRIESRATVREANGERLVRIMLAEGGSEHRGDRYPTSARRARIQWDPARYEVYFLCSARRLAAILRRDESGWDVIPLDFVNGPAGATEAISAQYVAACHPGDDMNRQGFAARHGYQARGDAEPSQVTRPEEAFGAAN